MNTLYYDDSHSAAATATATAMSMGMGISMTMAMVVLAASVLVKWVRIPCLKCFIQKNKQSPVRRTIVAALLEI